jgi:hypothetical protein
MNHSGHHCELCTMELETPYLIVTQVKDDGSTIAGMFCDDKCLSAYLQRHGITDADEES